jgi:hypothetical protein
MSFRFRKRVKVASGVNFNLGKKSLSFTAGRRGAGLTFGTSGAHGNFGIPGSGLSYRRKLSTSKSGSSKVNTSKGAVIEVKVRLDSETGEILLLDDSDSPVSSDLEELFRKQNKEIIISFLESECEKINSRPDQLAMFHSITPSPEFEFVYQRKEFNEPKPEKPVPKRFGFWGMIIPALSRKITNENDRKANEYESELKEWEAEKERFDMEEDELAALLSKIDSKVHSEKEKALECIFKGIDFPRETNIDFDLSDDAITLHLDVDLPEVKDMPGKMAKVMKRDLRLSFKDISETQLRISYMRFIHSILFVVAGVSFHLVPSLKKIITSGYSQRLNSATGMLEDQYLISAEILREIWRSIDFENLQNVDPVQSFELFETRRNMSKTGVFRAIDPFVK